MRNFYQLPALNHDFDFSIPSQAHNGQKSIKDYQCPNINSTIAHSNFVIAKAIRPTFRQSTCWIDDNSNSDFNSDNNVKLINIDLSCNKLNIQLLANDSITYVKIRHILETKDEVNEFLKAKITWEKKIRVK